MLRLAADENFNADIVRGLCRCLPELDIVRVQDVGLSGANDPSVLGWAAGEGRIRADARHLDVSRPRLRACRRQSSPCPAFSRPVLETRSARQSKTWCSSPNAALKANSKDRCASCLFEIAMPASTIAIAGSRHISRLPAEVRARLDRMIERGFQILVGDANGADNVADKSYPNVLVHCMKDHCRNNIGNWPTRQIVAPRGAKGFEC